MPLLDNTLFGLVDKVAVAIERLREFEPKDQPYRLAFSGGKDSITIKQLAAESGVKYEPVYNATTIDPPELVRFIREHHPDVRTNWPRKSFLRLVVEKGMPIRQRRWCCSEFKETKTPGRLVVTGIRHAESARRGRRRMVEVCLRDKTQLFLHPIIDWSEDDVWEFIRLRALPYCRLYDEGFRRIGCIMCPMAGERERERQRERWPRYAAAYCRAFVALWEKNKDREAYAYWRDGEDMFRWWLSDRGVQDMRQLELWDDDALGVFEQEGANDG